MEKMTALKLTKLLKGMKDGTVAPAQIHVERVKETVTMIQSAKGI